MKEKSKIDEIIEQIKAVSKNHLQVKKIFENIPNEILRSEEFISRIRGLNEKNVEMVFDFITGTKAIEELIEENGLEALVEADLELNLIARKYRKDFYKIAENYESKEEYEKAKKLYELLADKDSMDQTARFYKRYQKYYEGQGNTEKIKDTYYYKAKLAYYRCKIQNGEPLTDEDYKELEELAKEDKENILGLTNKGKISLYEIFELAFEDIPIDEIENEILPSVRIRTGNGGSRGDGPVTPIERQYDESLSPEKRLEHLKKDFEIEGCKKGKGKYTGFLIFKIKDSDVVIVEKFFDSNQDKELVPSYGVATYYVHKDAQIDLDNSDRKRLVERKREEQQREEDGISLKLIDSKNHRGKNYYKDQIEIFKTIEENGRKLRDGQEKLYITSEDTLEGTNIDNSDEIEEGKDITGENTLEETNIDNSDEIEEGKDITGEDILEETNIDNSNKFEDGKETASSEKEEESHGTGQDTLEETNIVNSQDSIEELIELIAEFDSEYKELQEQLLQIEKEISDIIMKINEIQEKVCNMTETMLFSNEIKEVIKREVAVVNGYNAKKKELEELKEKIIIEEKKNREEREKLKTQLNDKIKGE